MGFKVWGKTDCDLLQGAVQELAWMVGRGEQRQN